MLAGKTIPVTKENTKIPVETAKNNGLPEKISTEAQLWDEIFRGTSDLPPRNTSDLTSE